MILDASHMLKQIRNALLDCHIFWIPGHVQPAQWDHFVALYDDQKLIGLRAGNRMTKNHVYPGNHKMRFVTRPKYSVDQQLLQSMAGDKMVTMIATAVVNQLRSFAEKSMFYGTRCNSKSPKATGQKYPLNPLNFEEKKKEMMEIICYLKKVQIEVQRVKTRNHKKTYTRERVLLQNSNRSTAIDGFTVTITSIFDLAKELSRKKNHTRGCIPTSFSKTT